MRSQTALTAASMLVMGMLASSCTTANAPAGNPAQHRVQNGRKKRTRARPRSTRRQRSSIKLFATRPKADRPLEWTSLPDWRGVYTRAPVAGFAFDPETPEGGPPTAKLTPEYEERMRKRIEGVKTGNRMGSDLHLRAARPSTLVDGALPARVHRDAGSNVAGQRDGQRHPSHLHRRTRPRPCRRSLPAVQRGLDRLLGRRSPGDSHQPAARGHLPARTPGLHRSGRDRRGLAQGRPERRCARMCGSTTRPRWQNRGSRGSRT